MKIALICPKYPPERCGVGDYTERLARELARSGHSVLVCAGRAEAELSAEPAGSRIEVHRFAGDWGRGTLHAVSARLQEWEPEAVVIQYTPYLFGPKSYGIQPLLAPWVALLGRRLGVPIAVMAHELHYPVGLTPDKMLIGVPQLGQMLGVALAADLVFFTYEVAWRKFQRIYPWKRASFEWVPVGANVEPVARPEEPLDNRLIESAAIPERHQLLLHFGGSHPTRLFGHTFAALDSVRRRFGPDAATLVFLGLTPQEVERELKISGRMDLLPVVRGLDYVDSPLASRWLARADLVLAPFMDGVSTRRGSVMAALAHGKAVATTHSWSTDSGVPWHQICDVTQANELERFASRVVRLMAIPEERHRLGRRGKAYYAEHFDWAVIARTLLDRLTRLKRGEQARA